MKKEGKMKWELDCAWPIEIIGNIVVLKGSYSFGIWGT